MRKKQETFWHLMKMIGIVAGTTILGKLFVKLDFPETNIVIIYLLAVLLIARLVPGYVYCIVASILALGCYNYFFTEPYYTLQVYDPSYMITFFIMLATALLTSALTTKERLLTKEAKEKGEENKILYNLSSKLSDASDVESVLRAGVESLSFLLQENTGCHYLGSQFPPMHVKWGEEEQNFYNENVVEKMQTRFSKKESYHIEETDAYYYPVYGREQLLAVVEIPKKIERELLEEKERMVFLILENISLALDRIEVTVAQIQDRENMERERERANLLRAISHDLRTPLSGIMGTSEMLMDMTEKEDRRQVLLRGIYQDADWLKSLVENILSLTRLQDGRIVIHKEPEAVEEIIGSAVAHVEKAYPEREIKVQIPADFRLVPMDAKLIVQVITNLLENAIKHTSVTKDISVCASYTEDFVVITVQDEGEGIFEEDLPNLFHIFYTSETRTADVKKGIGLGLAICETVVKAHGGQIVGRNREEVQGAEFVFTLPLREGD